MFTLCDFGFVWSELVFFVVVVVEWLVCILLLFFEQMLEQTLPDGATNQLPEFLTTPCMVCVCVCVCVCVFWIGQGIGCLLVQL